MNESKQVPRKEWESDLDWLARNVREWPAGHQGWCYVISNRDGTKGVATSLIGRFDCPWVRIEKQEWLARRAGLQNKPSWKDAPEWAEWMVQSPRGHWEFFSLAPRHDRWWTSARPWRSQADNAFNPGELLGGWRDTLEKRPEHLKPFTSIEDNQEKAMKQDNGWFERGELPPVGKVCLYVVSDRLSAEVEITAHAKFGLCFVGVGKSGENYVSKTAELHRFRPIRTERDVLIEIIKKTDDTDDRIADAILAAGFKRGAA